jgi:integrase
MALKKSTFAADEIKIYDDAVIYLRGEYWQMRMWLAKERKYARFSLKTQNRDTAIDKAKKQYHVLIAQQEAGRTYFSKTTKQGVEEYLQQRQKDVDAGLIVKGRLSTIKTHLEHWLDFIQRDRKLKELQRTDCENYYYARTKTKKHLAVSQTTILNEQSTINALMLWLFKRNETYIQAFDFKKLPKIDKRDESIRRSTFTELEMDSLRDAIANYLELNDGTEREKKQRIIACYYFLIASVTGLRSGEQRQLKWSDLVWTQGTRGDKNTVNLVKIKVRAETSKVRNSRTFMVADNDYFRTYRQIISKWFAERSFKDYLIFSLDGKKEITKRTLIYHFNKLLELAEIDATNRDLVAYSLRHYFITQRIKSGFTLHSVADMCGTSIAQIEKTYWHISEEVMRDNAMAYVEVENNEEAD